MLQLICNLFFFSLAVFVLCSAVCRSFSAIKEYDNKRKKVVLVDNLAFSTIQWQTKFLRRSNNSSEIIGHAHFWTAYSDVIQEANHELTL